MSRALGPGVRVRVIPDPADPWVTDAMVGTIIGRAEVPVLTKGGDGVPCSGGWSGYSWIGMSTDCWDVAIPGWGRGPIPEHKLEPVDDEAGEAVAVAQGAIGGDA